MVKKRVASIGIGRKAFSQQTAAHARPVCSARKAVCAGLSPGDRFPTRQGPEGETALRCQRFQLDWSRADPPVGIIDHDGIAVLSRSTYTTTLVPPSFAWLGTGSPRGPGPSTMSPSTRRRLDVQVEFQVAQVTPVVPQLIPRIALVELRRSTSLRKVTVYEHIVQGDRKGEGLLVLAQCGHLSSDRYSASMPSRLKRPPLAAAPRAAGGPAGPLRGMRAEQCGAGRQVEEDHPVNPH